MTAPPLKQALDERYPWRYRRTLVFWAVGMCSAILGYLTLAGEDTRLNETLAMGAFALFGATLGSYVFGAVWHDRGLMGVLPPPDVQPQATETTQ